MKTIVVAVEFSPASEKAFAFAVQFAVQLQIEVIALYVINTTDLRFALREEILEDFDSSVELRNKVRNFIDGKFQALLQKSGASYAKIRIVTRRGEPWREIIDLARESQADMIIAGTHGNLSLTDLLLGSTTTELIRCAPCPVVTVRA